MFYRRDIIHVESEDAARRREIAMRILQVVLLTVFIGSFAKLATGPMPWSKGVQQRIEKESPDLENPKSLTTFTTWLKSEIDHPKLLRAKEHGTIGLWYGAAFAAGISFILLLTMRWWMPQGEHSIMLPEIEEDEADSENAGDTGFAKLLSTKPLFYALVMLAMAVGTWLRVPPSSHSLWNDEEYAMRRFAHGSWEVKEHGKKTFEPVEWTDTLFENHNGNNHLLHSALSRLSLTAWRSFSDDAEPSSFNEQALRMPSLLAGVITLAIIAFIGWELGLPWAGVGAAWFLALHPWHVRYAAEAKGYSLCLLFICLAVLGLIRALRHHQPGAWVLFAIGQAGFLLSFAGSIYVAVALNAVALIECLVRRRFIQISTLIAFSLIAAIPVLVWTLPSVPQLIGFMAHDNSPRLPVSFNSLMDIGTHVAAGILVSNPETGSHLGTSWEQLRFADMHTISTVGWSVLLLGGIGLIASLFENVAGRVAILAPTLAGGLSFWHASVQHHPNLASYYIYLLIPLVLACALTAVRFKVFPLLLVTLLVSAYALGTQRPRQIYVDHARQPIRETVQAIYEKRPEALTGTFGVSDRQAQSYDPDVTLLTKPEDVDALIARGQSEGRPVFIYVAGLTESTKRSPDLMKRVGLSADFIKFKEFKGLEAMFSYVIYVQVGLK